LRATNSIGYPVLPDELNAYYLFTMNDLKSRIYRWYGECIAEDGILTRSLSVALNMNSTRPLPASDLVRTLGRLMLGPKPCARWRHLLVLLVPLCLATELWCQPNYATPYTFSTLAGEPGAAGYVDGTGNSARFKLPIGAALDIAGNLYVLDTGSETIRKVSPAGVVTPFCGVPLDLQPPRGDFPYPPPPDGNATTAEFEGLQSICTDTNGNFYVIDAGLVREVSATGVVTTIAGGGPGVPGGTGDGVGSHANLGSPGGIAMAPNGLLYFADSVNDTIRNVDPTTGRVTTIAGDVQQFGEIDGTGTSAHFDSPVACAVDAAGNIFVADSAGYTIRKIASGNVVTTVAGSANTIGTADGTGTAAQFYPINGMTIDSAGNLYVTETNNTIRKITSAGVVTTLAGTPNVGGTANGTGAAALFNGPIGITVDAAGDMFVADYGNDTIRERYSASNSEPSISTQPVAQSVAIGSTATFSVSASGVPVPDYQWLFDGSYIGGATNPTLTLSNVQADKLGNYSVIVTSSSGTVTSNSVVLSSPGVTPAPPAQSGTHFANISTRAQVGTGAQIEILGFVISGPAGSTEQLLIRGDGPSIDAFGVTGVLENPALTLFDSAGNQIAANAGWSASPNASQIASAAASVGAFALLPDDPPFGSDSALLLNLTPGAYTAQVSGLGSTSGVALAEVYQVGTGSANLINISTRASVGTGSAVEIAGLVVQGSQPVTVLIRAVGPTLAQFSVSGVLAKPTLSVVDASGNTIATNTGWSTNSNAAAIATTAAAVGAFALPSGSADCALLLTLQPGSYTAIVSGVGGTSGVALVEAYQSH
jgi:sugar lactone lactonase YvrE